MIANQHFKLILENCKQLVCVSNSYKKFKLKEDLLNLCILENSSVIVGDDGKIFDIGNYNYIEEKYQNTTYDTVIDCTDKAVMPGFVDGHTHAICPGDRVHEFIMKLNGATYMDIHNIGGGIGFTTQKVKEASLQDLENGLLKNLGKMASLGTTTVEVKSGYGLDTDNEIKMLKVIKNVKQLTPLDIVSNYCGAHSIPKGMNEEQATHDVINNQIPAVKIAMEKGEIDPVFIDVFCEKGVYERDSTKKILQAGKDIGLKINFHGDEIKWTDSGTLGAELGAVAISHLENLDDNGITEMAKNHVAAVILPTTHYLLKLKDPPVRKLIDEGVIFALGSDFNPNAYCMSMPFVMNLVCINLKAKPSEALVGATLNSAASLCLSETHGSIEIGKFGDFVILNEPKWEHILYQFGQSPIQTVIKKGKIIYQNIQ